MFKIIETGYSRRYFTYCFDYGFPVFPEYLRYFSAVQPIEK